MVWNMPPAGPCCTQLDSAGMISENPRSASLPPGAWSRRATCISTNSQMMSRRVSMQPAARVSYTTPSTISDGISMGTEGMKYSLVSREIIADSIEAVSGCMGHDGIIAIGGCDKNMPGCLMGLARLNRPSIFIYGGTIMPGKNHTDIVSVFEAVGGHANGTVSDIELKTLRKLLSRAPDPAVACTRPIPWRQPLRRWA